MEHSVVLKIAKEFQKINKQLKLDIVGSLARGEKTPNDIDFITTLNLPNGKKYFKTTFKGIPIDIWKVEDRKIGKFIRTMDKGHLIGIYNALKKNNYKLTDTSILDLTNNKSIPFSKQKIVSIIKQQRGGKKINSKLQAVLFDKDKWSLTDAKKWFDSHNFEMPVGKLIHQTKKLIRFRVMHPNYKKYEHRIINIGDGIKFILAIPK